MPYCFESKTFNSITDHDDREKKRNIVLNFKETAAIDIHKWYERACTAEYILENYADTIENNDQIAYNIACNIRDKMDKYSMSESDAIDLIFNDNFNIDTYR